MNDQMMRWNGEDGRRWAEEADRRDAMLSPFLDPLLAAAALRPGDAVLDVGCGCGVTTLEAASVVTIAGRVVGADLSEPMLAVAERRAERLDATVDFVRADVATADFEPGSFDVAMSRFGVMFFDDPRAAFANIAAAVHPHGRLALAVWQPLDDNPWMSLVRDTILGELEAAGEPVPDRPPGPDPFVFGDPDWTGDLLESAGWAEVGFEPVVAPVHMGGPGTTDDAVGFAVNGGVGRILLREADETTVAASRGALAAAFSPHHDGRGVALDAAAWIVTARRA